MFAFHIPKIHSKFIIIICVPFYRLAELKFGLVDSVTSASASSSTATTTSSVVEVTPIAPGELDAYDMAKSYFDVREYDRAAYFLRTAESPVPHFLHFYSTYMAKEKRRLDNMTDQANLVESGQLKDLADLLATLKALHAQRKLDAYTLYLYGVVLKKLELKDLAITVLVESVHAAPTLWSSWLELSPLITHKEQLAGLNLPNHWMKSFFLAHTHIELFLNDEGLEMFEDLQKAGFVKCTYITAQIAIAYHNKRSECTIFSSHKMIFFSKTSCFGMFRCRKGHPDIPVSARGRSLSLGQFGHPVKFAIC